MLVTYPYEYIDNEIEYKIHNSTVDFIVDDILLLNESLSPCPNTTEELIAWDDDINCIALNCGLTGNHAPGQACEDGVTRSSWLCAGGWAVVGCITSSSGSGGTGTGPFGSPSGGGVDANNDTTTNDEIPVIPFRVSLIDQIEACMNNAYDLTNNVDRLTVNMYNWLNVNNRELKSTINHYLKNNSCDDSAVDFVVLAIEAMMDGGEVNFDDEVILDSSFKNNTKVNCIYEKLKTLNNSFISSILEDFDNNKIARLRFKIDNIPQVVPGIYNKAKTLPRYNGNGNLRTFDIVLDQNYVNSATAIEIAYTIIHEAIHAEIMERCIQLGIITEMNYTSVDYEASANFGNGVIISNNLGDILFALLMEKYSVYLTTTPNTTTNWHHDIFTAFGYRDRMKEDLAEIHPLIDDSTNPFFTILLYSPLSSMSSNQYFDLLAWQGLHGTEAYNNLSSSEVALADLALLLTENFYTKNCN